jgi:hypothetical protein
VSWQDRAHFFCHLRPHEAPYADGFCTLPALSKARGGAVQISFDEALVETLEKNADILALDEALTRFAAVYPRARSSRGTTFLWRAYLSKRRSVQRAKSVTIETSPFHSLRLVRPVATWEVLSKMTQSRWRITGLLQCSSDPAYCVVVGASTRAFQSPPGCLPHTTTYFPLRVCGFPCLSFVVS